MVLLSIYIQHGDICLQSLHHLTGARPLCRCATEGFCGRIISAPTVGRGACSPPQTSRLGSHLGGAGNVGANYGAGLLKRLLFRIV